ncbi:MAG: DUF1566 domain-containing protein [Treponema sp.]|jgi:hypothetical protein|nr:DUF1566 domain-containing protein [Treponema sp.]
MKGRIKFLGVCVFTVIFALSTAACSKQSGDSNKVYKIGDTGPAGGIVFYDRGSTGGGWRYLEAAPAGTEFRDQWGPDTNVARTETAVGTGKRNTQFITTALKQNGKAAYLCTSLNYNKHRDWYLPSKDELALMYNNLARRGLGGFTTGYYWSSSQAGNIDNSNAWSMKFDNGNQGTSYKNNSCFIRAVRAF